MEKDILIDKKETLPKKHIYDVWEMGNLGNYPFSQLSQYSLISQISHISHIRNYNKVNNNIKILILLFNPFTIKEISDILKIDIDIVRRIIYRADRDTGLLNKEMICIHSKEPQRYIITELGKEEIDKINNNLIIEEKEKQNEIKNKIKLQQEMNDLQNFFHDLYDKEILERIHKKKNWMILDFKKIARQNHILADSILDHTEETLKRMSVAIDIKYDTNKFKLRISNLPVSTNTRIGDLRSVDLNKLCTIDCIIKQTSTVKPQAKIITYECPSCGNIIPIVQLSDHISEPTRCGCGRKGKFKLNSKELRDFQTLKVEELPEQLDGRTNTISINVLLFDELTAKNMQTYYNPGSRIKINAIPKETDAYIRNKKSTSYTLIINANFIEPQEKVMNFKITVQEKDRLKELSKKDNLYEVLTNSYAPSIKLLHEEKLTVLLSLVGGNIDKRNEIHVLFSGDPGLAKSELLQYANKHLPFCRYASGTSSSSVGLTAGVVKDDITGGWSLEAGAVVMANNGVVCVDELDKLPFEQQNDLNECMEQQTVTINKAGVHGTLNAKTSLICASNPKGHRFSKNTDYVTQINLPHALFTRFDLVWVMVQTKQQKIRLLDELLLDDKSGIIPENDLIYYIFLARSLKPTFSKEMKKIINVRLKALLDLEDTASMELPISITPRQMFGLQRLTTAFAKLRLSNKVEECDFDSAWELFIESLKRMGFEMKSEITQTKFRS